MDAERDAKVEVGAVEGDVDGDVDADEMEYMDEERDVDIVAGCWMRRESCSSPFFRAG